MQERPVTLKSLLITIRKYTKYKKYEPVKIDINLDITQSRLCLEKRPTEV